MKCIAPVQLKYKAPRFVNGIVVLYYSVPCGKCAACMQTKRDSWSVRLQHELHAAHSASFLTLTYSNEYFMEKCIKADDVQKQIMYNQSVHKKDVQDFLKRLRYYNDTEFRYFAVGEYGEKTNRPHYHLLLFNINAVTFERDVANAWTFGNAHFGKVEDASINYVTSYVITSKYRPYEFCESTFALMSRRPGIGFPHIERNYYYYVNDPKLDVVTRSGFRHSMPRYYRDKLYNEQAILHAKSKIPEEKIPTWEEQKRIPENNKIMLKKFSKNKKI